jgi:hypothetical protein
MLKKALILLSMVAVLWLSGCVTTDPNPGKAAYGPCADKMDVVYCGAGN